MKLRKWNISRFWRRLKPRRKYKDKLFQRIFSDILAKSQSEVFNMLLTEYDEKKHFKMLYKEGREDGIKEAHIDAIQKTIVMMRKLNTPEETIFQMISEEYNMSIDEIKNIINQ